MFLILKRVKVNFKMTFEITVTNQESGVKPKNFLKKTLDVNYNQLIKAIKNKRITLNKKKIKEDDILKTNDIVKIWDDSISLRKKKSNEVFKKDVENLHLPIIKQTTDFLILDKKPGVVVQGAYHNELSLSKHLRYLEQQQKIPSNSLFHVHRLDKDTSGCLIIGNGQENIREFNRMFQEKKITKIYTAICSGWFDKKEGTINLNLKRNSPNTLPKVIVHSNGKPSKLKYNVIKEFEKNNQRLSLVEIELITGFMHQIRVSLHHLKHPILGDTMYSNVRINDEFKEIVKRQLLHASKIEFMWKNEKILVKSNFPTDFLELLE